MKEEEGKKVANVVNTTLHPINHRQADKVNYIHRENILREITFPRTFCAGGRKKLEINLLLSPVAGGIQLDQVTAEVPHG